MGGHPKSRAPQLARTDFESMTHEQLAALLHSANTAGASHLAAKLAKAASTISRIGSDLMEHVKGLEWQGEGGDSFRDWGGQTASATLHLGEYAEVASRWMETVSQAIAEAKAAMPDTSETARAKTDLADAHKTITALQQPGVHNDPDAQQAARTAHTDATAAQHRIDAARHEAVQQLRKLAQTYEYSAQQVNSVPPPTFTPPAGRTGPDDWWSSEGKDRLSGGSRPAIGGAPATGAHRYGTSGTSVSAGAVPASHTVHGETTTHVTGPHVHDRQVVPAQPASLDLDGLETLPRHQTPDTTGPAQPPTGVPRSDVPATAQPAVAPPPFSDSGRVRVATPSSQVVHPSRSPQSARPSGIATGRVPAPPRETGIVGGRPVASGPGRSQSGVARGTVIGNNNVQGQTGMARGVTTGGPGAGGSPGGAAGGRRLASETGGVIGNRAVQQNRGAGRPFTPGGSGLVRSSSGGEAKTGSVAGRTGAASNPAESAGSRKDRRQGRRPDYLVEDEETWERGDRPPLPPVVG
ncbi:hypothetical protein [Streptomyces sp. PsTaAH-124]|uniref:hypothetical protein n=1 Tax=Streptomyces sp. PsTaAH-124 TaxID=1157638 RepID=UPI000370AF66|nr:hypothetical protein [Streptomyces sp. PsTaAH-124]